MQERASEALQKPERVAPDRIAGREDDAGGEVRVLASERAHRQIEIGGAQTRANVGEDHGVDTLP